MTGRVARVNDSPWKRFSIGQVGKVIARPFQERRTVDLPRPSLLVVSPLSLCIVLWVSRPP